MDRDRRAGHSTPGSQPYFHPRSPPSIKISHPRRTWCEFVLRSTLVTRTFLRLLSRLGPLCIAIPSLAPLSFAQPKPDCSAVPDATRLRDVLQSIVRQGTEKNGGMGNQECAAVVNRDGVVCAIVFSGTNRGDQWPGSRLIAAEKANTANALSGNNYALSTAIFSRHRNPAKACTAWRQVRRPIRMPFLEIQHPLVHPLIR
jgi:hypothetical protein